MKFQNSSIPSTYIYQKKKKKGGKSNFSMGDTNMCHLNQVFKIKLHKQVMRQIEMVCPYRLGREGHSITRLLYLPRMLNLNLIMMKYLRIPN